jgi:hypothetical protein
MNSMKSNKTEPFFKSEEEKLEFIFWIETLRAGVLPKGVGRLHTLGTMCSEGYCCLGVGIACSVPEEKLRVNEDTHRIIGSFVTSQPACPRWLRYLPSEFERRTDESLILMNDDTSRNNHPEIADRLWQAFENDL